MPITITTKEITEDGAYVHVVLSTGEDFNVSIDWSTKYVPESYTEDDPILDTDGNPVLGPDGSPMTITVTKWRDSQVTLLQHEIDQACARAQAREDERQAALNAARAVIGG